MDASGIAVIYSAAVQREREQSCLTSCVTSALLIACLVNAVLWVVLFAHPELGFRDDLSPVFITNWIAGVLCAVAGFVATFLRISHTSARWVIRAFFFASFVLGIYGFYWALGLGINAIA